MTEHNGFTFYCDVGECEQKNVVRVKTERTAITHARNGDWLIAKVRVTSGVPASEIRTNKVVLCPFHKYLVLG
jgi:hypothetical protein